MRYLKIENGKVVARGLQRIEAENAVRALYPHTSFPARLVESVLSDHGFFPEHPTERPTGDVVTEGEPELRSDGKWYQTWVVRDFTPDEQQQRFEGEKSALLQAATDMRWEVMTGGMTLPGGIEVGTTIDDQNRITSVVANAELAGLTDSDEVDFKAASGWVRVTIAEIKTIAGAIGQHVQACYSAERTHHDAIEALTTREQIRDYDISVGWPDTQPETEPT